MQSWTGKVQGGMGFAFLRVGLGSESKKSYGVVQITDATLTHNVVSLALLKDRRATTVL